VRSLTQFARTRPALAASVIFALVCLAYLYPVLLGGRVLSAATMLYDVAPWAASKEPLPFGEYNRFLSDHPTAFHPWLEFARESVRQGHLPLWNPYMLAGTPFAGNAQAALFSPFTIPVYLLPLKFAFGVQAALRLVIAALGAYGLARELRLGFWPAVVTGLSYGFAPVFILWLSHPHANVLALVPWVLWLLERLLSRGRARDAILLALPVAAAMLGGHPGSQIHLLVAAAVYGAVRLLTLEAPAKERLRRGGLAALGIAAGLGLAAVALLPAYLLVPGSSGAEGRAGGGPVIPLSAFRTVLFPDWWGRPSALDLGGPLNYNERTLYAGGVATILACIGLTRIGLWRRWLPFVVLGLLGLAVPLGVEPVHDAAASLPLLGYVQNGRLYFLFTLAISVLAGFGVQHLLDRGPGLRVALAAPLVAVGIGLITLIVTADGSLQDVRTVVTHFRTGADFPGRPAVVSLTAVGWWLALSGATLLVVVAAVRRWPAGVVVAALLALVIVDLGHFARGYQPMAAARDVYPAPEPPALRTLETLGGDNRVSAIGVSLPPDSGMVAGLRDIRGHDPPEPDTRYLDLFRVANPTQSSAYVLAMPAFTPGARRVMDILGVRYVLDQPGTPDPPLPSLDVVYQGEDAKIYRNRLAAPRAYVPSRIVGARDAGASVRELRAPAFRAGRDAVVEASGALPSAARGQVSVAAESQGRVELRTDLSRGGLIVLNDRLKDGWSVTVDGRRAKAIRVNSVVRGAAVPPGDHVVVWSYRAPGLLAGGIVSLLTALALVLAALAARGRVSGPGPEPERPSRSPREAHRG
jgi:hypothetical protein